jgi:DNA adenine methylase
MGFINNYSPLRYPGGKSSVAEYFMNILSVNNIGNDGVYCEPFAGGAGVALTLLLTKRVDRIVINDYDRCIGAFWNSLLNNSDKFIEEINRCDISIESWFKYRHIYDNACQLDLNNSKDQFALGFATFFLNRTNRAGILPKAGPIGGRNQLGNYSLDARFKKDVLIDRIKQIIKFKDQITFTTDDALIFIKNLKKSNCNKKNVFLYLDPPYYHKGKDLYLNFYNHYDHLNLSKYMKNFSYCKWMMTYDNCEEIKNLYSNIHISISEFITLQYSIQRVRKSKEILIIPNFTLTPVV